jgi:acyl carrier protein
MTISTLSRRTSTLQEGSLANKIRTFIAGHLGVDVNSITVDSHFGEDLGLDLLDIVELTILLEEEFTNGEITDVAEEMEFVGDLIHHIEVYQCRFRKLHPPG